MLPFSSRSLVRLLLKGIPHEPLPTVFYGKSPLSPVAMGRFEYIHAQPLNFGAPLKALGAVPTRPQAASVVSSALSFPPPDNRQARALFLLELLAVASSSGSKALSSPSRLQMFLCLKRFKGSSDYWWPSAFSFDSSLPFEKCADTPKLDSLLSALPTEASSEHALAVLPLLALRRSIDPLSSAQPEAKPVITSALSGSTPELVRLLLLHLPPSALQAPLPRGRWFSRTEFTRLLAREGESVPDYTRIAASLVFDANFGLSHTDPSLTQHAI